MDLCYICSFYLVRNYDHKSKHVNTEDDCSGEWISFVLNQFSWEHRFQHYLRSQFAFTHNNYLNRPKEKKIRSVLED